MKRDVKLGEKTGKIELEYREGQEPRWLDIRNPETLLKKCGIDTSIWEVISSRISSSEVTMKIRVQVAGVYRDRPKTYTNIHVSIALRKRLIGEVALTRVIERLLTNPCRPQIVRYPRRKNAVMLEWCPYDQHHGLLAWGPEVDEHYDLKISERFFAEACCKTLATASSSYNIQQIVVPIGQDWFHANDSSLTTPTAKHRLDVEGRLIKVFETGYWALFRAIETLRQVAPVHILWVPGNHDPETSYYLVRALAAHYMDLDGTYRRGVTVDFAPRSRKIYVWGNSIIGFSHPISQNQWEKQRGIFSEVFRKEWGNARFHEIHTGHLHKVMEYGFMQANTLGGHTVIRMLPSLCATDKWHWEMGYVDKNRASASFIWSQDAGLVCQFTTRV